MMQDAGYETQDDVMAGYAKSQLPEGGLTTPLVSEESLTVTSNTSEKLGNNTFELHEKELTDPVFTEGGSLESLLVSIGELATYEVPTSDDPMADYVKNQRLQEAKKVAALISESTGDDEVSVQKRKEITTWFQDKSRSPEVAKILALLVTTLKGAYKDLQGSDLPELLRAILLSPDGYGGGNHLNSVEGQKVLTKDQFLVEFKNPKLLGPKLIYFVKYTQNSSARYPNAAKFYEDGAKVKKIEQGYGDGHAEAYQELLQALINDIFTVSTTDEEKGQKFKEFSSQIAPRINFLYSGLGQEVYTYLKLLSEDPAKLKRELGTS